jgi:lipopolysaccharide assembly outer membrane protein LptD (OstA)
VFAVASLLITAQSKNNTAPDYPFHFSLTDAYDTVPLLNKKTLSDSIIITTDSLTKNIITSSTDTLPQPSINTNEGNDSSIVVTTIDTIGLKLSSDSLDAPISYDAEDSMVLDVPTQRITLYGKETKTNYKDNNLTAPVIELDQQTGNIKASIRRDSLGKVLSMPTFKQGDFSSQSDSLLFNIKSGKGITKSTYTQQGEIYVYGKTIKKFNNDVFFVDRARFTTCNLDTPHFAFVSNKIKFINQKVAITGPVHPEFEGVPVPLYLPFGIFPLSKGRHSGFLMPEFTTNEQRGLGLEGLGYYKVLGDYWDVIVRGSTYSYGGWTLNINPRYKKLYKYNGNLGFDVQSFKNNFKGDPDYSKNRSYRFNWSHTADTRARPGVTFGANVNLSSSRYYEQIPNSPFQNFNNQLTSSINYSKTWKDKPFNLTVSGNHNQNTLLNLFNVNLPDVAFNVQTLYPFRQKDFVGTPKWFENIGVAYNGNLRSLFSFYDTAGNILRQIKDTFSYGAHHSVPISLSLPQIGAFQIGPSISYDETWYQRRSVRRFDTLKNKVDTVSSKGLYTAREMSFGVSASTRIFGLITAKNKNAKIQAIRHEIRPSLGFSYRPDLNKQFYDTIQVDTSGRKVAYSYFSDNVFSEYSQGRSGGISFSLENNLQMKVRDKKDTTAGALKKVTLIDGLSLNTFYNLLADSFNFSPINISLRSNLFEKINLTGSAQFDPYQVDASGERINELVWKNKPISLGRLTSGSLSASSSFQGGGKNKAKTDKQSLKTNDYAEDPGYTNDEYQSELDYINNNPVEYADFNIPWSVNFSYALRFSRIRKPDYTGFTTSYSQDVNFGGTLNLTPKWQIGLNGSYNITQTQLGVISVSLAREMHCWQMAIQLSPVGKYRFFSINISPKSGLLRDLKINRTRSTTGD